MKNKKGISVVIGYILLVAISIVMSILVYQWLKTYVPKETPTCSEGTSIFVKGVSYDCMNSVLNITIKNNGKFSVNGYFIHASTSEDKNALATIDLSNRITSGGNVSSNSIIFSFLTENSLTPDESNNIQESTFDVSELGILTKIEIIPTRIQEVDEKKRVVSCTDAKVEEILTCS